MAKVLLSLSLWSFVHADQLSCTPPIDGTGADALKVAFHAMTQKDICHLQDPRFDDDRMANYCSAFCATNGQTSGLPLQVGFFLEMLCKSVILGCPPKRSLHTEMKTNSGGDRSIRLQLEGDEVYLHGCGPLQPHTGARTCCYLYICMSYI